MSIEEQKKFELNNELNAYKKKWNIVETNRQTWQGIGKRLQTGQNKSQKTFAYHFKHMLINTLLGTAFILLPFTFGFGLLFYSLTFYHSIKMIICGFCFTKLKKGVQASDRIHEKYVYKKYEIEANEEKIYQQIEKIEQFTNSFSTTSLFEKCIERTSNVNTNEEITL